MPPYFSFGLHCSQQQNFPYPVEGAESGFKSSEAKRNIAAYIIYIMPQALRLEYCFSVIGSVYFVIQRIILLKLYYLFINWSFD